jgi:hypothetical protein
VLLAENTGLATAERCAAALARLARYKRMNGFVDDICK